MTLKATREARGWKGRRKGKHHKTNVSGNRKKKQPYSGAVGNATEGTKMFLLFIFSGKQNTPWFKYESPQEWLQLELQPLHFGPDLAAVRHVFEWWWSHHNNTWKGYTWFKQRDQKKKLLIMKHVAFNECTV